MTNSATARTLLRMALDALESADAGLCALLISHPLRKQNDSAVTALRTALAQPAPEPVAWWIPKAEQFSLAKPDGSRPFAKAWQPLYAAPQAQPAPAPVVPAGWVMVPTHLTVDQLERFVGRGLCCGFDPITEAVIDAGHKWARLLDRIAAAPAQPAVPLTDDQIAAISLRDGGVTYRQLARAIEAFHGIGGGNHG